MGVAPPEEAYAERLRQLLPRGSVWEAPPGSRLHQVLEAIAAVLRPVHARALVLLEEIDPRTTNELLTDWERALDIPGPCTSLGESVQQRRDAIVQKWTAEGGQTPAYYLGIAAQLGHENAEIIEYDYLRAGDRAGDRVIGESWKFAWTLASPDEVAITVARAGQAVAGDPLRSWGNEPLECAIEQLRPAHTTVVFAYGS